MREGVNGAAQVFFGVSWWVFGDTVHAENLLWDGVANEEFAVGVDLDPLFSQIWGESEVRVAHYCAVQLIYSITLAVIKWKH